MANSGEILDFWFDDLREGDPVPAERNRLWFGGDEPVDRLIQNRFTVDLRQAAAGEYDSWNASPRGTLALLILLDQFPRNIHRHSPCAYAFDDKARGLCLEGLARGQDRELITVERAFFYLPLEHAEDLSLQDRSVALFTELLRTAPPSLSSTCRSFLDYAGQHRAIIERFGRFPHRNAVLGRSSTAEEEEFLRQPGSSF